MNERGFTSIEVLVVTGLLILLIPVIVNTMRGVSTQTVDNGTRISALTPLDNTGRWLGEDIPLAQATSLVSAAAPQSTMTLEWTSWVDTSQYDTYGAPTAVYKRQEVTYSLSGSDLQRQYRVCSNWNLATAVCAGSWTTSATIVARKITTGQFSRTGSLFTVNASSYPSGCDHPGRNMTYQAYGALLGSQVPIQ
jgi:type II secretory pathway pseudopilin PulG